MIRSVEKPKISPNFTIDDIHKIREYHYELTKDMNFKEKAEYYRERAKKFDESLKIIHSKKS